MATVPITIATIDVVLLEPLNILHHGAPSQSFKEVNRFQASRH
jgi:hypothetical protein